VNQIGSNFTPAEPVGPQPEDDRSWSRRAADALFGSDSKAAGDPRGAIRIGLWVTFFFFVLFIGWAAFARLDAGVTAQGYVVVSGNRKAVQHREGGIVDKVFVHEGDRVRAGQILITLAAEDVRARERSTSSQAIALKAYKARLAAEIEDRPSIEFPAEFSRMTGEDLADARLNMRVQEKEFRIRRLALLTQKQVLRQRVAELQHQAAGDRAQASASERQGTLIQDELVGIRDLERQGYVAMSKVRELERAEASYRGSVGQYQGNVSKSLSSIGETQIQMISLDKNQAADAAQQYREADLKLADLGPQLASLRTQLGRTIIRAPASGRIVGLKVFTNGGVVAPGDTLMEIVPEKESLVIRVKVDPNDIDDLIVGERTEIRIPAFHNRGLPILNGSITKLSADRLIDAKSEQAYFEAEVAVPPEELKKIRDVRGSSTDLIVGLPVDIVVPQRKRTALDYFFEPIHQALWRSFREQ
jgi:HlyD family type I secretion membrane fusion protein